MGKSTNVEWRVNTPQLLKEILANNETQILNKPLAIFGMILHELGERASELNDPELNAIMCRLSIYEIADPYSKNYDAKLTASIIKKAKEKKQKKNNKPMTQEDYKNKIAELIKRFELDKQSVRIDYAFSNNPYKIGDIITDHIGSIKIDNVKCSQPFLSELPCCVYIGLELKKDGTPTKAGKQRTIYQSNIIA